ncbi:prolyl aminopeptidase Serine peptidase. MEROPS family S33 [Colwellia chukchiensis]|uniref:Proline iminopeptidase n=1 Tax=Colwellia chukchiensis TaxID=641665 RepID=A0A1H7RF80_9GAMM|nr:prolyl aminopeptidase [Colwellia chukchiensis]SEL58990.1 prolyl aminopeptidase Serine peptidase. MEROPS family S33 [Colwellia chukchiensis]
MSRLLFPNIMPYQQEWLDVGDGHQVYLEQSGNPNGIAVIYLHGGPGAGASEKHRCLFDPDIYRIILFDQRGCGRSKPSPSLQHNTTTHLLHDLSRIRQHLNIAQWLVCGGSWGTTLALLYGLQQPETVLGFILRGVFLGTASELDWLYSQSGAAGFFPEYYREFIKQLPANTNPSTDNILTNYYQALTGSNEVAAIAASKAWCLWELRLSSIEHHNIDIQQIDDPHQALCMAKISSHYFVNNCFIDGNYILSNLQLIKAIPAIILHGRYDMGCQPQQADRLVQAWQNARLQILPQAGHSGFETQTVDGFCQAADTMATFIQEQGRNQ